MDVIGDCMHTITSDIRMRTVHNNIAACLSKTIRNCALPYVYVSHTEQNMPASLIGTEYIGFIIVKE